MSTCHKGGGLFVPHLDEPDPVFGFAERLDDAVDPIAWNSEHSVNVPVDQRFNEDVTRSHRHDRLLC